MADKKKPLKVEVWSSESGWGQKLESTHYFDDIDVAMQFYRDINALNTLNRVPDYYEFAKEPKANI